MIDALKGQAVEVVSYLPKSDKVRLTHEFQVRLDLPESQEALERLAGFLGEKSK